jgi:glutamine amidotransferase
VKITADPDVVRAADRIVLPGVGSFKACAEGLRSIPACRRDGRARAGGRGAFPWHLRGHAIAGHARVEHGITEGLGWIRAKCA